MASNNLESLRALLDEVRQNFTRDDDLPDNLLPRIDEVLADSVGWESYNETCQHGVKWERNCQTCATPAPEQATTGSGQGVTDAVRLDWLDQNIFHREITDDWDKRLYPDRSMWVTFAPKGHQGSARNIIDAAILSTASPAGTLGKRGGK